VAGRLDQLRRNPSLWRMQVSNRNHWRSRI